jgi:hypothetical protein
MAPTCGDGWYSKPEFSLSPRFELGESTFLAARCLDGSEGPRRQPQDASCTAVTHARLPRCAPERAQASVSVARLLEGGLAVGDRVAVRGRVSRVGILASGQPSRIGLTSDRDYQGICLSALLVPGKGAPDAAWQCERPRFWDDDRTCCDNDPARPPTGSLVVVDAVIVRSFGNGSHDPLVSATLAAGSFCVVDGDP